MSAKADLHGHRTRLRERLLKGGAAAVADYELLELLLFCAIPRGDTKPLAKRLIAHFGSFAAVMQAEPAALSEVAGVGIAAIAALRAVTASAKRMLRSELVKRPVIQSWTALLDYTQLLFADKKVEAFHILFLDKKNALIADETQQRGTIDHTPVYPREVMKRALEHSASAVILVHNHPSGNPEPSKDDIAMTQEIVLAGRPLGIRVHDHLIVAKQGHYSFKSHGLI